MATDNIQSNEQAALKVKGDPSGYRSPGAC